MAQGHHSSHHRRSPSGSNTTKVKPARPALHRKGASSVNHSISKLGAAPVKQTTVNHIDDDEFEMAASFLNFWYVSCYPECDSYQDSFGTSLHPSLSNVR